MHERSSHSDWKPGKMGRHFPVREKSGNFEQKDVKVCSHLTYFSPSFALFNRLSFLPIKRPIKQANWVETLFVCYSVKIFYV